MLSNPDSSKYSSIEELKEALESKQTLNGYFKQTLKVDFKQTLM